MAAEHPITPDLVEAFCVAIMAFDDWKWGCPEPEVFLDGQFRPVSAVAQSVSALHAPMPGDIYDFLCRVIGPDRAPADRTFAAGGKSLYRSCQDLQSSRRA